MSRLFPPEIFDFFEANNKGKTAKEMADLLNTTFGTSYTVEQIKSCRARNHWNSGLTGRFTPGHISHNKGQKGRSYPGMENTQFKKGNVPHNHRPVGSERITRNGYVERKIAEPNVWRALHVLKWEETHGPLPEGYVLIFKDRDKRHIELDNLLPVTKGELAIMNHRGWCCENPEATETALCAARYINTVSRRKKEKLRRTPKE